MGLHSYSYHANQWPGSNLTCSPAACASYEHNHLALWILCCGKNKRRLMTEETVSVIIRVITTRLLTFNIISLEPLQSYLSHWSQGCVIHGILQQALTGEVITNVNTQTYTYESSLFTAKLRWMCARQHYDAVEWNVMEASTQTGKMPPCGRFVYSSKALHLMQAFFLE